MAPTTIEHLRTLLDSIGFILPVNIRNQLATCLYIYLRKTKSTVWDTDPNPERLAVTPIHKVQGGYGISLLLYTSGVGWENILSSVAVRDPKDVADGMERAAMRGFRDVVVLGS
jgi:hypothetical protein